MLMKYFARPTALAALAVNWLCLAATPVFAQAPAPAPEAGVSLKTIQALAYGLVLLGIVLGLMNVVRPGKRKGEKPKPV